MELFFKISHVGKHEYAANVITYPTGDWYGYVKPQDVSRILNQLSNPNPKPSYTELGDIWRGAMHLSTEEQIVLSPKAFIKPPKTMKRNTTLSYNWDTYGFGPVGNEALNSILWIILFILSFVVFLTLDNQSPSTATLTEEIPITLEKAAEILTP